MPRGKKFTRIQLQFLHDQYQVLTGQQLRVAFNKRFHQDRSFKSIRSCIRNHRMTCGNNMRKGHTQKIVSEKELAWLTEHYVDISVADIAAAFNKRFERDVTREQMKAAISRNKLKSGRTGCYPKGHVPDNKGLRRPGWAPGRMAETQFKVGPRMDLRLPFGHERTDKDGYILIKVDMINPHTGVRGYYVPKHKVIWEQANGRMPDNHVLTFIDDDRSKVELENLELISRGELCRRNKLRYLEAPPELRPSIKALAKLQHYAGQRARNE